MEESFQTPFYTIYKALRSDQQETLKIARKVISGTGIGLPRITALNYYCGEHFKYIDKELIYKEILSKKLDMIIISSSKGIVHALEKIEPYTTIFTNKTINQWIRLGLPEIIMHYILNTKPAETYWFTRKNSLIYRILLETGKIMKKYLRKIRVYHVYPYGCKNPINIYKALGMGINELIKTGKIPIQIGKCILVKERITKTIIG